MVVKGSSHPGDFSPQEWRALCGKEFGPFLSLTLENWEQDRAKPNAQAVLLISLVEKFSDTVGRLASV